MHLSFILFLPSYKKTYRKSIKINPYLLVYFSHSNCHILQVLDITVTGIHATAGGDAMIGKVSANGPVGVTLDTTATQLKEEKIKEKISSCKK